MAEQTSNYYDYDSEKEVTFTDILKVCLKYKYVIIALTLAIMIFATTFIQVFYNPNKTSYTSNFAIYHSALPAVADSDKDFHFYSDEVLDELSKNEELAGIDFEKIKDDGFTLGFDSAEKSYASYVYERPSVYYSFSANSQIFPDQEKASKFVDLLANSALKTIEEKLNSVNYDTYLNQAKGAMSYTEEISALRNQQQFLVDNYTALAEVYGEGYIISGKTISEIIGDITYDSTINVADNTVISQGYVKKTNANGDNVDERFIALARQEKASLEKKILENEELITKITTALSGGFNGEASLAETLNSLILATDTYETKKKYYDSIFAYYDSNGVYKYDDESAKIDETIADFTKKMTDYTAQYKKDTIEIFNSTSKVIYEKKEKVSLSGGLNIYLSLAATLVAGFAISLLVVYLIHSIVKAKSSEPIKAKDSADELKE